MLQKIANWYKKGFVAPSIVAGVLLLLLALLAGWFPLGGKLMVLFGIALKGVSEVLSAVSKMDGLEAEKSEAEQWVAWLDAFAVCLAFPGLFGVAADAVGAEIILDTRSAG